jgi:hypothetical protein
MWMPKKSKHKKWVNQAPWWSPERSPANKRIDYLLFAVMTDLESPAVTHFYVFCLVRWASLLKATKTSSQLRQFVNRNARHGGLRRPPLLAISESETHWGESLSVCVCMQPALHGRAARCIRYTAAAVTSYGCSKVCRLLDKSRCYLLGAPSCARKSPANDAAVARRCSWPRRHLHNL